MTTTATHRESAPVRAARPGRVWAVAGVGYLLLGVYVFSSWLLSGEATRTPTGSTPVPGWMKVIGHTWEAAGLLALAGVLFFVVVRPWRQKGEPTTDGLLVLGLLTLIWADPLLNYHQVWQTFNASLINFGSWSPHIPGVLAPNGGTVAIPIVWLWPTYGYMFFAAIVAVCGLMEVLERRFPQLGRWSVAAICVVVVAVVDAICEPVMLALGIYAYPGAIQGLSLFPGRYYQLPLYMPVLLGVLMTTFAALRHYCDPDGRTVVERGIDGLRTTSRRKTALRYLALVGVLNTIYLGTLEIPMQFFGVRAGAWPEDIVKRSYLTNGVCGEGTTYACPGPKVPVPRPDSARIGPDGQLVHPGTPNP